jgi:two-component system, cell cycle sensor histidine kinase and response regulator CckA
MKTLINRPIQVLLVEDNPGDARLLQEILADVTSAEFELIQIDRLEAALQWLNANNCDIILLDLSLPDSHGLETIVRTCTQAPTIPIIVLTGLDDETLAISAMQEGAQDYLVKGLHVNSSNMLVRSMRYAIQRKQSEQALKRQIERERLVTAIALRIRQSLDLDEILNTTVAEVRQFLQSDRVLIFRVWANGTGKTITEAVLPEWPSILGMTFPEEVFPQEYQELYRQGRIRAISDVIAKDAELTPCLLEFVEQWGVRAKLVVPILVSESLWGLLIAHQCSQPRQWQPLEIELLQQLATQVGIAVQQAELYQQAQVELRDRRRAEEALQQRIKRERLITKIAQRIRRSLNLNDILNTTVEEVRQFLNADRTFIYRFHPDWSGTVVVESVGDGWISALDAKIADSYFMQTRGEEYRQGRIQAVADIYTVGLTECHVDLLAQFQIKANLVVPILQGECLIGLLVANECSAPRQWQPWETELLQQLATQLGIAIQQSELYEQVQIELRDRKLAEQKVRQQAALLEIATDAIFVRDLDHRIRFWNRGAERLYGWQAEDVMLKNANDILYREIAPELLKALKAVVKEGEWQGELHKVTKAGKDIVVASRWSLARDAAGEPKAILTVDTDITEKKQLEAQFLRAQRLESLGTLAGGITHDLNNMLTPILASSELLQMRIPKDNALNQKLLKMIETSAERGADLVRQVLSFTRGIEGQRTNLSVKQLIAEIKQIINQTFPKSIKFTSSISADLWAVSGDATQLHQVLINLAVNARDAMPNGGELNITASNLVVDETFARTHLEARVGQYVGITVSDTGIGISPEVIERIFEPFFTTKEIGKGTGLGLSTAIGIIKSHGGFVTVSSQINQGTQFKLFLPAVLEPEPLQIEELELPQGNGELILIVDDEPSIREITQISLDTYNYKTIVASDGFEAITQYSQHQDEVALILMDMMMPTMGGATAIRTLQKINPQVKIVAISGVASTEMLAQTAGSGVQAFLAKPCTSQELLTTLHNVLSMQKR